MRAERRWGLLWRFVCRPSSRRASASSPVLSPQRLLAAARAPAVVTVPEALRGYEVERTPASVYDRLLAAAP